ncbi:MAG TPA: AraC family transcriptional regulator [Pseudonocardia sp.]
MTPEMLGAHRVLTTNDLDEARARIGTTFCEHRLDPIGRARAREIRFNAVAGDTVGLSWLDYGGAVRLRPHPFRRFVLVHLPLAGRSILRVGGRELVSTPGIASVPDPDEPSDMVREPGAAQLLVRLDRARLERRWAAMTGCDRRTPLRLAPLLDLRTPAGQAFVAAVDLAREVLGAGPGPLVTRVEDLVTGQFLLAQPHHAPLLFDGPNLYAAPRLIRQAERYLEAHAREAVTVDEAAAAVGLSVRALQAGFRRYLGTTPTERLRTIRLAGAHRELGQADPMATTVSDVASAWGFGHLGRFAVSYRAAYGRAPSATLRG